MKKFTRLIAPALVASLALGAAVPATAAKWDGRNDYRQQINQLERQVQRAEQRRLISQREAQRLERQVEQLDRLHRTYSRGGFTKGERQALERRIDSVERQITREIRDRDGRRR